MSYTLNNGETIYVDNSFRFIFEINNVFTIPLPLSERCHIIYTEHTIW